jgi:glycosyltransferase involved in cell wall biosynthesis/ribosomal protein S18 acetylase RimI-like enzyme
MKIAHLTTVDISLRFLIRPQLVAALDHGEVLGISAAGEYVEELELLGIRHVALASSTRGVNPLADVKTMIQFWKILRKERPDILHTHNPKPGVYGRILGRLAGVPIVINTVHGLYATDESAAWKKTVVYGLEYVAARFSDAELVQNPEDVELLRRYRIVPRERLKLLGNGVDLSRFSPERARSSRVRIRAELGIGPDEVVVGAVGRLVAEKGLPELVEAATDLGSSARFVVVGPHDPDKADSLDEATIRRGERAGIQFLGMRQDIDAVYGAFVVFVLASHREGYPRAAMEAAASGLPLVATDIRGCRQVVEHETNGLLVPARSPDLLTGAIRTLVDDPDLRVAMGRASSDRARRLFDERIVVEKVMDTYGDLADRKGLMWEFGSPTDDVTIRGGGVGDEAAIARLHARMISTGFLSTLGHRFLELLYRQLILSERGMVVVAEADDAIVGFVAGASDTGAFYKEFLRRNLIAASIRLVPAMLRPRSWKRIWETLRYGSESSQVRAELLSTAVAPGARGRGVGLKLVQELLSMSASRDIEKVKVVVGAENTAAIGLYERAGFAHPEMMEVHAGTQSLELVWSS